MTGLTPHLARTLTAERQRSAEQHRAARRAADEQTTTRRGRSGNQRATPTADTARGDGLEHEVAAAQAGDEHAWALLQERYATRVRTVARMHRLAPHDIDDVAQATWMRLFENIGKLRDASAIGAWLETTARRESLALIRRRNRERPTADALLPEQPSEPVAEGRLVADERRTALASSMGQLPQHQRRLLVAMCAEPTPTYAELADSLEIPIGSIGPTRARSLERLRRDRRLARIIGDDVDWQPGALE